MKDICRTNAASEGAQALSSADWCLLVADLDITFIASGARIGAWGACRPALVEPVFTPDVSWGVHRTDLGTLHIMPCRGREPRLSWGEH